MSYRQKFFTSVACVASFTAILLPQTAKADPAVAVDLPALVSDKDLDKLRGGFLVSGLDINFGADIRTYVNGALLLHTVLNWSDEGVETVQIAAEGLSPVDAAALQNGVFSNGNIRMKVGDTPVYLINGGQTAIVHETGNGVQNMLINTASGFNSVQEVDATLNLSGYENFNANMMMDRISSAIDNVAGQAAIGALGN
ncbi:MAG: hypothetical protein V7676_13485 [Parasphingorhabdus sp.]|uniref:hypothetical protein n=1 Tax=Parasphingorhabdus sp. TaxID=2709688 RepID=UPI0030021533